MNTIPKTYPQIFPAIDTYPLWSDSHSRVPSTWLKKFQAFENASTNALIHRNRGPSTTTYYSFKENKRKTKGTLGKVSYAEIFRDVKNSKQLDEDEFGKIHPNGEGAVLANVQHIPKRALSQYRAGLPRFAAHRESLITESPVCANAQPRIDASYSFGLIALTLTPLCKNLARRRRVLHTLPSAE